MFIVALYDPRGHPSNALLMSTWLSDFKTTCLRQQCDFGGTKQQDKPSTLIRSLKNKSALARDYRCAADRELIINKVKHSAHVATCTFSMFQALQSPNSSLNKPLKHDLPPLVCWSSAISLELGKYQIQLMSRVFAISHIGYCLHLSWQQ